MKSCKIWDISPTVSQGLSQLESSYWVEKKVQTCHQVECIFALWMITKEVNKLNSSSYFRCFISDSWVVEPSSRGLQGKCMDIVSKGGSYPSKNFLLLHFYSTTSLKKVNFWHFICNSSMKKKNFLLACFFFFLQRKRCNFNTDIFNKKLNPSSLHLEFQKCKKFRQDV